LSRLGAISSVRNHARLRAQNQTKSLRARVINLGDKPDRYGFGEGELSTLLQRHG
jgi:hypothetical protein